MPGNTHCQTTVAGGDARGPILYVGERSALIERML
jgi:hypothetical protein